MSHIRFQVNVKTIFITVYRGNELKERRCKNWNGQKPDSVNRKKNWAITKSKIKEEIYTQTLRFFTYSDPNVCLVKPNFFSPLR